MSTTRPSRPGRSGAVLAGLTGLLSVLLVVLTGPASAAPGDTAPAEEGWVRLSHLSPDTPGVDVSLTPFAGGPSMPTLSDVGYGDVSEYQRVPTGTYTVSLLPAGSSPGDAPVITQAVTVEAGQAYTVATLGRSADLTATVFTDDLTPPAEGSSRIRLLQASVSSPTVDVQAAGGPLLAQDAAFGSVTGYAEIAPGVWTVQLTDADGGTTMTDVAVQPGTVSTLTVLDRDGQLDIAVTVDSSGVGAEVPTGGVETGGGSAASSVVGDPKAAVPAALAVLGLLTVSGAVVVRHRRTTREALR